jgi:hypothetical protein
MLRRAHVAFAVTSLALAACKKAPAIDIEVSTGLETGALSVDPKVVRVDVVAKSVDGKTSVKASAAPRGSFDLGEVPDDIAFRFELTGVGADGTTIARGRSVDFVVGSVLSGKVPLFMQRLGSFSRPPGAMPSAHVRGYAAVFRERYLLLTGGDSAADAKGAANPAVGDFYDLLALGGAQGGLFSRSAGLVVARGNSVLVADANGGTWTDLSTAGSADVTPPDGLAFADVIGGTAFETSTGDTWIVGATRQSAPSAAILVVGSDSTLTARTLTVARQGAAAAWIAGVGLVVAGGSATTKGIEIVPQTGSASVLPYPADDTTGAALVTLPSDQAMLVGGTTGGLAAPTRVVDLRCAADCAYQSIDSATVSTLASRTSAFAIPGAYLVVGDDPNGQTRAFRVRLDDQSATELPFREPRLGATAVAAPNGTLLVLGGSLVSGGPALDVESYFPE